MSYPRAFTIVELMVTVAIIIMVTAVAIPNLSSFKQRQTLERTAQELRNTILQAQAFALAPRRTDTDLIGYAFGFSVGSGRYGVAKVSRNPRSVITDLTSDPNLTESSTLPAQVAFGQPSGTPNQWAANSQGIFEIDFLIGTRAKAEAPWSAGFVTSGILTIPLQKDTQTKTVKVSLDSGSVTIE